MPLPRTTSYYEDIPTVSVETASTRAGYPRVEVLARAERMVSDMVRQGGNLTKVSVYEDVIQKRAIDMVADVLRQPPILVRNPAPGLAYGLYLHKYCEIVIANGGRSLRRQIQCDGKHSPDPLNPASALHWDRSLSQLHPVEDPVIQRHIARQWAENEQEFRPAINHYHWISPGKNAIGHLRERLLYGELGNVDRFGALFLEQGDLLPTGWAVVRWAANLQAQSLNAMHASWRRLLDPEAVRLTRRTAATRKEGEEKVYDYLCAAQDPVVRRNRRQFVTAYPEQGWPIAAAAASEPKTLGGAPDHVNAVIAAIDEGKPLTHILGQGASPPWVARHLRGQVTSYRFPQMDLYEAMNRLTKIIACLGPAWRIERGDGRIALTMGNVCELAGLDLRSAIGSLVQRPEQGGSPWKRLLRMMPQDPDEELKMPGEHLISDAIVRFHTSFIQPLLVRAQIMPQHQGHNPMAPPRFGATLGPFMAQPTMVGLFRLDRYFHKNNDLFAQQFRLAQSALVDENGDPVKKLAWGPLFEPYTTSNGIRLECLTDEEALQAHADEMHHCVYSYGPSCLYEHSHIIRLSQGSKAISTIQIVQGQPEEDTGRCSFKIVQHYAHHNGQPPAAAVGAATSLEATLARLNQTHPQMLEDLWKACRDRAMQRQVNGHHLNDNGLCLLAQLWRPFLSKPLAAAFDAPGSPAEKAERLRLATLDLYARWRAQHPDAHPEWAPPPEQDEPEVAELPPAARNAAVEATPFRFE